MIREQDTLGSRKFWHQRDERCRLIAKEELADAAGRDPIFIEKIKRSFLTELVGGEHPSASRALKATEEDDETLLRLDGPIRVEVVLWIIPCVV
jgi:hypothetical protein